MSVWYENTGADSDVVLSTRIRLARNADKIPFPAKWLDEDAKKITESVKNALEQANMGFEHLNLDNTPAINKRALVEEHLLSVQMLEGKNKSVFLDKNRQISLMVGEEDHIRMQVIMPAFDPQKAYETAKYLDRHISSYVDYAYTDDLGFLTRCPTNVGTGLRASVMLHLPALKSAGRMNLLSGEVGKLGLTIRGIYGEGSESVGNVYQLSNQITLGISEAKTIEKLISITNQIIKTERDLREKIKAENSVVLEDKLYRSYGTLRYSRKISSNEAMGLLSNVKLGVDLGIIKEVSERDIVKLMILCGPAHVQLSSDIPLSADGRDIKRAQIIADSLKGDVI